MNPCLSRHRLAVGKQRGGYTLVEMLVAITAGVVVMAVAAGLLHSLMRLEEQAQRRFAQRAAVSRLADQFRRDAHAAIEAAAITRADGQPAEALAWEFRLSDDRRAEYTSDAEGLLRAERTVDRIVRQERFAFASPLRASIAAEPGDGSPLVRLRVEGVREPGGATPLAPTVIEACLSLDHRFEPRKEPQP